MQTDIFDEAQEIRGYNTKSVIAMCLFAATHTSKADRQAIKAAWECDPVPYARAVDMMPAWFDGTTEAGLHEYLSLVKIAGVKNKFARALLAEEWQRLTLSFDDVRERVKASNQRKSKASKEPKRCPHCGGEL